MKSMKVYPSPTQRRVQSLYTRLGSWRRVADETGIDRALLCRIANLKQRPPRSVVKALRPPSRAKPRYRPTLADIRLLSWAVFTLLNARLTP